MKLFGNIDPIYPIKCQLLDMARLEQPTAALNIPTQYQSEVESFCTQQLKALQRMVSKLLSQPYSDQSCSPALREMSNLLEQQLIPSNGAQTLFLEVMRFFKSQLALSQSEYQMIVTLVQGEVQSQSKLTLGVHQSLEGYLTALINLERNLIVGIANNKDGAIDWESLCGKPLGLARQIADLQLSRALYSLLYSGKVSNNVLTGAIQEDDYFMYRRSAYAGNVEACAVLMHFFVKDPAALHRMVSVEDAHTLHLAVQKNWLTLVTLIFTADTSYKKELVDLLRQQDGFNEENFKQLFTKKSTLK